MGHLVFGAKKMKMPGVCFCVVCHKKIVYGSNGKTVLTRHQSEASHKADVNALRHTSSLSGATFTTTEVSPSMADCVCTQKVCICSFITEHDLSLTILQPPVNLIRSVAEDQIQHYYRTWRGLI